MADALETQVVLAARDSLLSISPAAGYSVRPRVQIGFARPNPLTTSTLMVHEASGSNAVLLTHYPPSWEHHVRFAVLCLAHGSGEDGRTRNLLNLTADVRRRLLRQDRTLGGLVQRVDEAEPDETDETTLGTTGEALLDFVARITTEEEE